MVNRLRTTSRSLAALAFLGLGLVVGSGASVPTSVGRHAPEVARVERAIVGEVAVLQPSAPVRSLPSTSSPVFLAGAATCVACASGSLARLRRRAGKPVNRFPVPRLRGPPAGAAAFFSAL